MGKKSFRDIFFAGYGFFMIGIFTVVAFAMWLFGCSVPTETTEGSKTPLGITVIGWELLDEGWETVIDDAWTMAQECYGVMHDGGMVTVEIQPGVWPHAFVPGHRVTTDENLRAIYHEFQHLTQNKGWIGSEVPPCI